MKVALLTDGLSNHGMVVLNDFTAHEVEELRKCVSDLAKSATDSVDLVVQLGVVPVDNFKLSLAVGRRDLGLVRVGSRYDWVLKPQSWDNIEGLVQPLVNDSKGFQMLSDVGEVSLLISSDGKW